jgi:single-stranded DNA-specific DHH superfamily exonuclease
MRTTLTLDEDVADRLKALAERRKAPFKQVLNDVLRQGLAAQEPSRGRRKRFRVVPFRSSFRPGVDPLKLNQLSDELEVDHDADRIRANGA